MRDFRTFTLDELIDKLNEMKNVGIAGRTPVIFRSFEGDCTVFGVIHEPKDTRRFFKHEERIVIEEAN